jgi:hypothetical protein
MLPLHTAIYVQSSHVRERPGIVTTPEAYVGFQWIAPHDVFWDGRRFSADKRPVCVCVCVCAHTLFYALRRAWAALETSSSPVCQTAPKKHVRKVVFRAILNSLKSQIVWLIFKNSVLTAKKTLHSTVTEIEWLTLFKEISLVCTENHTEPRAAELLVTEAGVAYSYHNQLNRNMKNRMERNIFMIVFRIILKRSMKIERTGKNCD